MTMLNQYAKAQRHLNFEEIWNEGEEMSQFRRNLERRRGDVKETYRAELQKVLHDKPLPRGVPSMENAIRSMSPMVWFFEGPDDTQADGSGADTVAMEHQPADTV
jgi:hypothetical protein